MKKSLFATLLTMALAMSAQAETTYFFDLTETTTIAGLTYTRVEGGLSTITTADNAEYPLFSPNSSEQASTTVSFTFDLTSLKENYVANSFTPMAAVRFLRDGADNGGAAITIYKSSAGKYEAWVSTMSTGEEPTFAKINSKCIDSNITADFTADGREYATFTLTTGKVTAGTSDRVGFTGADADGNLTWASAYSTASNTVVDEILLNTAYLTSVAITPESVTDKATIQTISHTIPEPATATLSLLALAGLAARRRRK